jgi:hypothetical protein
MSGHAQVSLTPMIGGYVPGGSFTQVRNDAQTVATTRDGTLSLGLNLELGGLRGSLAYASGTTIKNASRQDIGKGSVLGAAADLVVRPLPRLLVQPYLLVGAGEKFYKFDESSALTTGDDTRRFALHGGIGADLMLGSVGLIAEVTDFLSKGDNSSWNVHDAFVMVGMKLRLP